MSSRDIKDTALKYMAHRSRTVFEMKNHLQEKEFSKEETEEALLNLLELKYLDDYNYSREFIRYGVSKGKGVQRIKRELIQKGVEVDTIDKAIGEEENTGEALGVAELERALAQAEKTVGDQEITEKIIGKLGRRLSTLGYSMEVVYKVIGIFMKRSGEEHHD